MHHRAAQHRSCAEQRELPLVSLAVFCCWGCIHKSRPPQDIPGIRDSGKLAKLPGFLRLATEAFGLLLWFQDATISSLTSACRWQNCKLLAKEEQDVDTGYLSRNNEVVTPCGHCVCVCVSDSCPGIPLATAAWFILRQPHQEMLQIEDRTRNAFIKA